MAGTPSPPPRNQTQPAKRRPAAPGVAAVGAGTVTATGTAGFTVTASTLAAATAAVALATAGIGALAVSAAIPAGIVAALIPLGVSVSVARIIARQVLGGTLPGPVIGAASAQAFTEARTYRAAYIVHAAVRVQARVAAGQSLFHAVRAERHLLEGHLRAQAARMDAARTVDRLARTNVWLMWQLGPTRTHTPVCLAAAGHMFPAGQRPLHGWPGSSHPGCLCTSVPGRRPRPGERTVDQVIAPLVAGGED